MGRMDASAAASATDAARGRLDLTSLPTPETLLDRLRDPLGAWLPTRRWFAHRPAGPAPQPLDVEVESWAGLRVQADVAVLWTVLAVDDHRGGRARYQVPLALLDPDAEVAEDALVTRTDEVAVADALALPAGRDAVLAVLAEGSGALGPGLRLLADPAPTAQAAQAAPPAGPGASSRVLSGEQSNTSLIHEQPGRTPVILKVFRLLGDGENPDVVLQSALTSAGSPHVPAVLGSARIAFGERRTHALVAQEFLPGVEDAWRTMLREAAAGRLDEAALRELGTVLARVHADLALALGTVPTGDAEARRMLAQMRGRLTDVASSVPAVAAHVEVLGALLHRAAEVPWPAMQRIHGDLHLGQVLAAPGRGWVLLDFEGEPLRPLAERLQEDCPLRDVAGMLRSLDYAAAVTAREHGIDAAGWALAAREAFLDGYLAGVGIPPQDPATRALLAAFEADKAVYEALYESRNRPDWLDIPLAALSRISATVREG